MSITLFPPFLRQRALLAALIKKEVLAVILSEPMNGQSNANHDKGENEHWEYESEEWHYADLNSWPKANETKSNKQKIAKPMTTLAQSLFSSAPRNTKKTQLHAAPEKQTMENKTKSSQPKP